MMVTYADRKAITPTVGAHMKTGTKPYVRIVTTGKGYCSSQREYDYQSAKRKEF